MEEDMITVVPGVIDLSKVVRDKQIFTFLEELAKSALLYPTTEGGKAVIEYLSCVSISNSTHKFDIVGGFVENNKIYFRLTTRQEDTLLPPERCLGYVCDVPPAYRGKLPKEDSLTLVERLINVSN